MNIEDVGVAGWSETQGDCRLVFESNARPMWVFSERGIVDVNRAALLQYDFSRDEFLSMAVEDLEAAGSLSEGATPAAEPSIAGAPKERVLGKHKKRDGTVIDVELSSFAITFGGMPATLRSAADVTYLRRTAAQTHHLDLLLAKALGALVASDESFSIAGSEAAVRSAFGTCPSEVLGPSDALAGRKDFTTVQRADAIRRLVNTGRFQGELTHRRQDGKRIHLEARAMAFFDSSGTRLGYLSISRDVTELHHAEETIRVLLSNVLAAQEEERCRTARELDDESAQTLASILLGLRTVEQAQDLPRARETLGVLRASAAAVLNGVKRIASGLRPSILDHLGLAPALEHLANEVSRGSGFFVDLRITGAHGRRLPESVETALYRIAQEALTNARKHAAAKTVGVLIHRNDRRVRLVIEDDGKGFDVAATPSQTQLGIMGMRERALFVGGSLTVQSSAAHGTTLCVSVPLPRTSVSARVLS